MIDFLDEFKRVVAGLEAARVEYAVCGGWALALLGAPRATDDIDLLITTPNLDSAKDVARQLGFVIEAQPMTFHDGAIEIRRISKPAIGWTDDVIVLDFLLVTPPIADVWEGRQRVTATFGDFWVVSREGFLRLKEISGRAKDLADIERLAELAGRADDMPSRGDGHEDTPGPEDESTSSENPPGAKNHKGTGGRGDGGILM